MVTLNFTMHREIATMLEEAAYRQLKLFETKQIGIIIKIIQLISFYLKLRGKNARVTSF